MTKYVVLKGAAGNSFEMISEVAANSSESAIKEVVKDMRAADSAVFVAVPKRSWKPKRVQVLTTVHLKVD
ncbi:MAG: hypothetical protein KatS3mg015_2466 [Fimbriimonadales bacterium]|nr:MAG: hypothetical protein KatS3mg015_2466 [Fimbriimonadales bacterium]